MLTIHCDAAYDGENKIGVVACVMLLNDTVVDVLVLDFPYFGGSVHDLEYVALRVALRCANEWATNGNVIVCADNDVAITDAARVFLHSNVTLERIPSKGNKAHKYAVKRLRQLRAQMCCAKPILER